MGRDRKELREFSNRLDRLLREHPNLLRDVAARLDEQLASVISREALADFRSFIDLSLESLADELASMTAGQAAVPRILVYQRREANGAPEWYVAEVEPGDPMLFPRGEPELFKHLQELASAQSPQQRIAAWCHAVHRPPDDIGSVRTAHVVTLVHSSGDRLELLVHGTSVQLRPPGSELCSQVREVLFDSAARRGRERTARAREVAEQALRQGHDEANARLVEAGAQALAPEQWAVLAPWAAKSERLLPALLTLARDITDDYVTALSTLNWHHREMRERTFEVAEAIVASKTEKVQEEFDRRHKKLLADLKTANMLLKGATDASRRAQTELAALKRQAPAAPSPSEPQGLARALDSLFAS